jgi:chromosome partitioning protein
MGEKSFSQVIAIASNAGGTGKTTTTRDLARQLALSGKRVLAIDADPTAALSKFLGHEVGIGDFESSLWGVVGKTTKVPQFIQTFGFDLVVSHSLLAQLGDRLPKDNPSPLKKALRDFLPQYDFVLIDCAPSNSFLNIMVYHASDQVLIPTQTEMKAVDGLVGIQEKINEINDFRKEYDQPILNTVGILPTLFDRRLNVHRHNLETILGFGNGIGCQVFEAMPKETAITEACQFRLPIQDYRKSARAVAVLENLAERILNA